MTTVGIVLAAGRSLRFGPQNKLLARLRGQPLAAHAAAGLRGAGCDHLIAVAGDDEVATLFGGFEVLRPGGADPSQSDSLRAAISRAEALGASKALITLADMPFVSAGHLRAVLARAASGAPSASTDGTRRMPPACFPRACFEKLRQLEGDRGAQLILRQLPESALVTAGGSDLLDIDTAQELVAAQG